jgi:hypothetical protein
VADRDDEKKSRLDSVIPDILKRAAQRGKERAQEAPENLRSFVGDKIPKEFSSYVLHQVDETKSGIVRVVAGEVRSFLEATNLSSELRKLLTTVKFEIHTTIRFSPNDDEAPKSKPKGDRERDHKERDAKERDPKERDAKERERERDHDRDGDADDAPPPSSSDEPRERDDDDHDRERDDHPRESRDSRPPPDSDESGGLHIDFRSGQLPKIRRS